MSESFRTMVRKPSAFLPIAMSLMALALLGGAYIYGRATGEGALVREPDEGSIAQFMAASHGGTAARAGTLRHQVATASAKADAARACATGGSCAGRNGTRLLSEPVNFTVAKSPSLIMSAVSSTCGHR